MKAKNYRTKEKSPLFFPLTLFYHFMNWGIYPPAINVNHLLESWYICCWLTNFPAITFQPLSFESKKSYTLKVEGANPHLEMRFLNLGPFQDTTTVHISVEDVDEPPVFEPGFYFVEVPEDVTIGTTIQIISAKDPDVTNNSIRFCHRLYLSWNLPFPSIKFSNTFPLCFFYLWRLSWFFKFVV